MKTDTKNHEYNIRVIIFDSNLTLQDFIILYNADTLSRYGVKSWVFSTEDIRKEKMASDQKYADVVKFYSENNGRVEPKTSTYDYDEIKNIVFNVCDNNLNRESEKVNLSELSNKIKAAIEPVMKKTTDTLHVWTEYVDMLNKNGFHSKMGDITIHVDIFEAPFGKLYNFVFVYQTTTKETIKQEEKPLEVYNYTELQYIIKQCCSNNMPNLSKDKLIRDITLAIKPKLLSQLHTIEVIIQNGCSDNAIVANVNILSYNKKIFNIFVTYKAPKSLQSEVEPMSTSTNKNYKEHIENIIHKAVRTHYDWKKYKSMDEYVGAMVYNYCLNHEDIEFKEITNEGKSLFNDYQYKVTLMNLNTNMEEGLLIVGSFERAIHNLEKNWLEQEEIPLKVPTKQSTSYDGSDVHYNSYCRVKKLYSGYGCGQPNEKLEIEHKENTNYPAFLTKSDMGILATLTKVFLLHGDTTYDNYVLEQADQLLPDKKFKIVRKDKLEDSYFYVSNHAESVWSKVTLLELVKPTIEKQLNKKVEIDYEQLQILIKSYNDNGGNIMYDYDNDRLIERLD